MWNIGIDVGGTFTDLFAFNKLSRECRTAKVLTTRPDRSVGVIAAIDAARIDCGDIDMLVHGSTTATNALIERTFPKAAMICTEGFRDVIEIGRQRRDELFNPYWRRPDPLIERKNRFVIPGRLDARGQELAPFDAEAARALARQLAAQDVQSVAICFINSYVNDAHEVRMRDILLEEHPGCSVALSSHVLPKMREHARFSTTAIRAVILPVMSQYFDFLGAALAAKGFAGNLRVLKSNGGMMGVDLARERPEELVESGPSGGVAYARYLADKSGYRNIIHTDMGGTTFDASIIEDGQGLITHDYELEWEMPLSIPMLDIRSVGTGGGSIAWVDQGGSLRVGPLSASSTPGPACYGNGGTRPTVTDANLLLGRINPTLNGKFALDKEAARVAIASVGDLVGLDPLQTAEAIIAICTENLAQAIKLVLLDRGRDPRDFILASFGGAGGMHACQIAKVMSIPRVVVPLYAGVASAFGGVAMECRHDLEAFYYGRLDQADFTRLNALYDDLERRARDLLAKDGVAPDKVVLERTALMRYVGQSFEVVTPMPMGLLRPDSTGSMREKFNAAYQTEHGISSPDFMPEFVGIGLTATGRFAAAPDIAALSSDSAPVPLGMRPVYFDGQWRDTPLFDGPGLGVGAVIAGPAIVEYPHSCVVMLPDSEARLDPQGNLIIMVPARI